MASSPASQAVDMALMQGVASGDAESIQRLYDRFASLIYRMAYQVLPSRDDAEDAVQEVFVRLWRTASRYDSTRAALVTWVMLITRRFLVDRLRRSKTAIKPSALDEKLTIPTPTHDTDTAQDKSERFKGLMTRIDKLPALQKTVVTRAYLNGQTLRQIGEELNTPLGTIKSALSRALVRLRENEAEGIAA